MVFCGGSVAGMAAARAFTAVFTQKEQSALSLVKTAAQARQAVTHWVSNPVRRDSRKPLKLFASVLIHSAGTLLGCGIQALDRLNLDHRIAR